ncbi:GNAT family N-acetyltransferase [Muricoccus radiodurans]|uniref:GNAT family N-acetyltransferase n=1 Tax=Muricoccus radiodurans TaxID=2231721 RepID=UPI003CF9CBC1
MADAVTDNRARHRFEMEAEGHTAFIDYRREAGHIVLIHTEVPKALEGHGIGSRLVRGALELIRAEGLRVVPRCSFVAAWIERHPEAQDLVAAA